VLRAASAYFAQAGVAPAGGESADPETVMNFVDAHDFSVGLVLRVLGVAASTYYGWRTARRTPSRRAREDAVLLRLIDEIRSEHEFAATYGSPRVWLANASKRRLSLRQCTLHVHDTPQHHIA
jgi:hypothetical protein